MGELTHFVVLVAVEHILNQHLDSPSAPPGYRIRSVDLIGEKSGVVSIPGGPGIPANDTPVLRLTMDDGAVYDLTVKSR